MIVDLHAHSSGISKCCRISCEGAIDMAIEAGLDGMVLTNHYQRSYLENTDTNEFVEKYIGEFINAKEYGQTKDFKVFFGIEITMEHDPKIHMLVYGVPFDFLRENPEVFALSQSELYTLVKSYGGVLVQAHPFRKYIKRANPEYLDGVEVFNAKADKEANDNSLKWAEEINTKIKTSGSDCHRETGVGLGGIITEEPIKTNDDLLRILKSGNYKLIRNQK